MTTKTTIALTGGIGAAVLISWLTLGKSPKPHSTSAASASAALADSTRSSSSAADPAPGSASIAGERAAAGRGAAPRTASREDLHKKVAEEREREVGAYLATLKSRFKLTVPQVGAIGEALAQDQSFASDYFTMPDAGWQALVDKKLAAVVSAEQKEALGTYLDERRVNRVQVNTTREMANLQQHLTLSPEQKDKVYELLSNYADSHDRNPDTEAVLKEAKVLRDGMSAVLTPDQMKIYERTPAARVAVQKGNLTAESDSPFANSANPSYDGSYTGAVGISTSIPAEE